MKIEEAKHKLDYMKKAYQKLIDEKVDSGKLVGDGVRGEWKAETQLDEAYKSMIDALEMAIKALEQQDKVLDAIKEIRHLLKQPAAYVPNYDAYGLCLSIICKHMEVEE